MYVLKNVHYCCGDVGNDDEESEVPVMMMMM